MASTKPALFAREATGLVREIGFTLGVIIILTHVIGLGWQKRAFQFTGPRPMPTDLMPLGLPAIFWAFLVCGVIVLVTGYAAGYVAAAMPRSGGGYVTISRVIHPVVGYMSGWLMFLAEAFSYGLIGVAVFEGISIFFGIALAPGTIVSFDAFTLFLGGLAIVWIFAILALFGTRMYGRLLQIMFYIPAAITIIFFAMWIAGALNPGLVVDGVTKVMGAPPSTFVTTALNNGMASKIYGFFDAFSYAIAGAFWAYMGWYATTFLAGEVKEANRKLPMVVLSAGLIVMVVYLTASSISAASVMVCGRTRFLPSSARCRFTTCRSALLSSPALRSSMTATRSLPIWAPALVVLLWRSTETVPFSSCMPMTSLPVFAWKEVSKGSNALRSMSFPSLLP